MAFHEYQRANWRAKHGLALLRGSMCIIRSRANLLRDLWGYNNRMQTKSKWFWHNPLHDLDDMWRFCTIIRYFSHWVLKFIRKIIHVTLTLIACTIWVIDCRIPKWKLSSPCLHTYWIKIYFCMNYDVSQSCFFSTSEAQSHSFLQTSKCQTKNGSWHAYILLFW